MRAAIRAVGKLIWYGFGLILAVMWVSVMYGWLGLIGALIAVAAFPAGILLPLIVWMVDGYFPWAYALVWGCSMVGVLIAYLAREDATEKRVSWVNRHSAQELRSLDDWDR